MSDIKMSDVFQLPVSCEEVSEIGVELFDNNEDAYAAFAINNHDRLTKENAQLKADKAELIKALNGVMNIVAASRGVGSYHCNGEVVCWWDFDEIAEVSELIQKHKEQNNA